MAQIETIVTTEERASAAEQEATEDFVEEERVEEEQVVDKSNDSVESSVSSNPKHYNTTRDSSWLELDVCREFSRGECSRTADECKYAHPTGSVVVRDGKVTCCFDFLKDRCIREACKYLHPSHAIKEKLVMAGKQHGQAMAVTSKAVPPPISPTSVGGSYSIPYLNSPLTPNLVYQKYPPPIPLVPTRVEICEDFDMSGDCVNERCLYAHPEPYVRRNSDNTVSVCFNYVQTGYCSRHNSCWFFHPPPHMLPYLVQGLPYVTTPFIDHNMYLYNPVKSPYSPPNTPFATPLPQPMVPMNAYSPGPYSMTSTTLPQQAIVS